MTARIYVHPRCVKEGPAQTAMQSMLDDHGFDLSRVFIGPPSPKGYREIVRRLEEHPDASFTYMRMDGTCFRYPAPRAVA